MFSSKEILLEKNTPYLSNNSGNYSALISNNYALIKG